MKEYLRVTKFTELKPYDHLAKDGAFIEVTEWYNGEGFDVAIGDKQFQLTYGEFEALQALVHHKG